MRSRWKLPFVHPSFIDKNLLSLDYVSISDSRNVTIIPDFVGKCFIIDGGMYCSPINVTKKMVGHKFGEFRRTKRVPMFRKQVNPFTKNTSSYEYNVKFLIYK
jgi:ribosomal protein S19